MNTFPKDKPLPRYINEFEKLGPKIKEAIIIVQVRSKEYWWNPHCKTKCLGHNKVHRYSFEAYVEGFVTGYFGYDTLKEMLTSVK